MSGPAFQSIPRKSFLLRMLPLSGAAFIAGLLVMGLLSDQSAFRPQPIKSADSPNVTLAFDPLARGALSHWRTLAYFWFHVPEVCWSDNAVSDFQKQQCSIFWEQMTAGTLLGFLPLLSALLFLLVATRTLDDVYRHGRRQIREGKAVLKGTVTDPALAPDDVFSRTFELQPIAVQLPDGKQIKVYLSPHAPIPRPGQTLAIFKPRAWLGQDRHLGTLHAPHLAVIRG